MTQYIESIAPLPGNTGYAVTFTNCFQSGMLHSLGVIQGITYRTPPKLKFAMRFDARVDPFTLKFVCDCADDQLVQSELLTLMKELKLVSPDLDKLPLSTDGSYQPSADHEWSRA